jgi:hypothetical protein
VALLATTPALTCGAGPTVNGTAFFEVKIRPVLVERCYSCHSAGKKTRGGLALDTRAGLRKGGANGPVVVPGKPAESRLIQALRHDGELRMPPKNKLSEGVIADFVQWVELGAPDPREPRPITARLTPAEAAASHWSFRPLRRPAVPTPIEPSTSAWCRNPIDRFVLASLNRAGLKPAPEADPAAFLRRVTFDLLGLPPSPEEVEAFLADRSPLRYQQTTDRLLASPAYGERWGRHWLDVARYADSAGYEIDNFYDHAWLYRDFVIRSFNADKPFDTFIREQLAGDELRPTSEEAQVGTGFCTVGPYAFEGGIARPAVVEYQRLTDLADTVGSAFLGLTVGCARCHDHKFDPISQADYFGLQAVFASSRPQPLKLGSKGPAMQVLADLSKPPPTRLLLRGESDTPGDPVPPAKPRLLPGGGVIEDRPDHRNRRAELARWLTSRDNPLPARVLANRVWQWHFGQGLVRTPSDFGTQGEPPTHPELLDWLACELIESGWSLKRLHRLILDSATYRMSSSADSPTVEADPDHRLLSRFPRRRLEAEAVWDHLHATAGTLDRASFGPAVYPPVDREILASKLNVKWEAERFRSQWNRRGVYMVVRRSLLHPFFDSFNSALPTSSTAARDVTVVAPQALELLNGAVATEQARAFAGRLLRECGDNADRQVARAWLLAFGRPVSREEAERARLFLTEIELILGSKRAGSKPLPAPTGLPAGPAVPPARAAALVEFCLALLNANEFLYID